MKICTCLAAWLCLAASASATTPIFRYSRDVKLPSFPEQELLKLRLDAEVFAEVRDGLPDVYLFDESVAPPMPYVVRKAQATKARTVRKTWSPQHLEAKPLGDGGLEIIVRLKDEDPRPDGVRLITTLRDFEHRVRVFSSVDGKDWEPLTEESLVFDYSKHIDVRNDEIPLAKTDRKHFRIVVDDVTAEQESELLTLTRRLRGADETDRTEKVTIDRRPFRIDRLEFLTDEQQQIAAGDEKIAYPPVGFRVETDPKKQQTVVTIDARRAPLTSLQIETPDRNFGRRAVVEVPITQGTQTVWRSIAEGTLSRVDFKSLKREALSLAFAESRQSQFRIVIDDRAGPPLQITGVAAEGNAYDLYFLAAPNKQYRLNYGAVAVGPATYDTAAIEEVLKKGFQPLAAELGKPHQLTDALPASPWHWSDLLNNGPVLFGVIGLLAIVLGFGLFRAMKRVDGLPRA